MKKSLAMQFRPEIELLLHCCRPDVDSERAERIRALLRKGIDSVSLIRAALRHGLVPLLYWNLNTICSQAIPKTILDQLRDYFETNAEHNNFLARELLTLLKLFECNDIVAIPFKGPVLAISAYDNLAFREISDLDVLVHRRDLVAAEAVLESHGYQLKKKLSYESSFVRDDKEVAMDLHTGFNTPQCIPLFFDFERLCERLRQVAFASSTVATLSPEDTLIVLCAQLATDRWLSRNRLLQTCDINAVIETNPTLDWPEAIKQAQNLKCQRMLHLGIRVANNLFETALPKEILQKANTDREVGFLAKLCMSYFSGKIGELTPVDRFLFEFHSIDHLRDQITYTRGFARKTIVPQFGDRARLPLPPRLSFLYYLIRPVRLVWMYGASVVRYILHELREIVRSFVIQNQSREQEATYERGASTIRRQV